MNIYNYFFKTQESIEEVVIPKQLKIIKKSPKLKQIQNSYTHVNTIVFLVIEKNTSTPLGIFDSFQKAKQSGEKITHHNCIIIPFTTNDPCKYLFTSSFESL